MGPDCAHTTTGTNVMARRALSEPSLFRMRWAPGGETGRMLDALAARINQHLHGRPRYVVTPVTRICSRRVHKWTRLERFGRGGPRPAPRPRSKFADFTPPAAEPLARLAKNCPMDGQFFTPYPAPCSVLATLGLAPWPGAGKASGLPTRLAPRPERTRVP